MEPVTIQCTTCEEKQHVILNTARGILCNKCGGSAFRIIGGCETYFLQCPRCRKEFIVDNNSVFDSRMFKHCGMHVFMFTEGFKVKKEEEKVIEPIKKEFTQLSFPLTKDEIISAYNSVPHDRSVVGIVTDSEPNHKKWTDFSYLIKDLEYQYHVVKFNNKVFGQSELALMNQCDLMVGQYTGVIKNAFLLGIPTILLHNEINVPVKGEVSLFGLKHAKNDELFTHIQSLLSRPSISYCIVTYNQREIATECLDAVYKTKKFTDEVVIVDNNSTDGMRDYLIHNKEENTQYIFNEQNVGCVKARNQAMKAAHGRTLFILDSDQIIQSDTLHKMRLSDGDIVGSEAWHVGSSGICSKVKIESNEMNYTGAGGMLVSKLIAEILDYFDEQFSPCYYEDPDFCFKAIERGYTIRVVDNGIIHKGPSIINTVPDYQKIKEENSKKFINKWQSNFKRSKALSTRPQIVMLVDVPGWAWDVKAKNIKKYLYDDFNIQIRYQHEYGDYITDNYDAYFVFDCVYVRKLAGKPSNRICGGVTAHTYVNFDGYKELLKRCDYVHANSMLLLNELKQINSNAYYIPNGVDEELFAFTPRDAREEFHAGYVGKNHDRKGFYNFIVPACEQAGVVLKSQTAKYNDRNKIDPKEMPEFYHDIDCVVIASDMDGTPNQLLEAASVGRTFVGVNIGNVPEFYNGKNGFIVDREVDEIAEKLHFLKKNRKQCKNMGVEARTTIDAGWIWKIQAQNYKKLFSDIINNLT